MTLELDVVAKGLGFPEGPVALPDGSLLFVDIYLETLSRVTPSGSVELVAKLPGGPNGAALGPDGAAYVCNNGGAYSFMPYPVSETQTVRVPDPAGPPPGYVGGSIQRVDLKTGEMRVLYTLCDGEPLLSPDDLVFDAHGGFYFTATGFQTPRLIRKGAVYYATPDGASIRRVADIPSANGIGLSPDGRTLYVADTLWGRLWALTVSAPGVVEPGPLPGMPGCVVQTLPGYQWLDSLKVEADGRVCVGTLLNGGITVFEEDGTFEHVALPDLFITNLCFAGEDMRDVYITASSTGTIYKARWPRPGLQLHPSNA